MTPGTRLSPRLTTRGPEMTADQDDQLDSTATVVRQVATILDSPPLPEEHGLPSCILEVRRIQSGVGAVLEANLEAEDEARLLAALARQAARAQLPEMALDAIVSEINRPAPPGPAPTSWQALRRLHRAGYLLCPACRRDVPSPALIDRLEARHREAETEAIRSSITFEGVA